MARDDRFDGRRGGDGDPTGDEYDDADYDGQDDDWTDEDETRYQARRSQELKRSRRLRRQAISFLVLVLLVLGAGLGAAGLAQGWWEWPFDDEAAPPSQAPTCGPATPIAALPSETTVVVLNATETRGLAAAVSELLTQRGFEVADIGNEEDGVEVAESAQIRYGPDTALQARALSAQFVSPVLVDDGRTGAVVEVSIGLGYTAMVAPEVAAAAIAPVPGTSPAGCVPASTPAPTTPTSDPAQPPATTPATTP